ncbi:unnamed protein product [Moneuplotes crassus]|uniref:Uncharacterized protein n=1 Tax=Euplotes crassus TaxID=5936 RepID=A0AAD2D095_EUPCR|nr:unnamed protein product [Moneuplotes crassus]
MKTFYITKMSKIILENPSEARFSTIEQAVEHSSDCCDERVDYIKQCFNKILENIVNIEGKCIIACLQKTKPSEMVRRIKTHKNKLKYQPSNILTNPSEIDIGTIYFQYTYSPGFIKFAESGGVQMMKTYKKISKCAQNLIKLRNEILNHYNTLKETITSSEYYTQPVHGIHKIRFTPHV